MRPQLVHAQCCGCGHDWEAFFPDGRDEDEAIECPECRQMLGEAQFIENQ